MSSEKVSDLPKPAQQALEVFLRSAQSAFQDQLRAVVLYGSAAEGRLRPASDINVIVLLSAFDPDRAAGIREAYAVARAAVRLKAMFLLEAEIASAAESFAQKFADVLRRRRILYGEDPFSSLAIPREATLFRLKQVLLNLTLRLREIAIALGEQEERICLAVADAVGPVRACAATLHALAGGDPLPPKEALERFVTSLPQPGWNDFLRRLSEVRETRRLPTGESLPVLLQLIELTKILRARAEALA